MKRTKIGDQWYKISGERGSVGVRCFGRGSWGVYFRDPSNRPTAPTTRSGDELRVGNYKVGAALAAAWLSAREYPHVSRTLG